MLAVDYEHEISGFRVEGSAFGLWVLVMWWMWVGLEAWKGL